MRKLNVFVVIVLCDRDSAKLVFVYFLASGGHCDMDNPRWIKDLEKREEEIRQDRLLQSAMATAWRQFGSQEAKRRDKLRGVRTTASPHRGRAIVCDKLAEEAKHQEHLRRRALKFAHRVVIPKMRRTMSGVRSRNDDFRKRYLIVRTMGFPSYAAYLSSDLWARIRRRVLSGGGIKCAMCRGKSSCVHHERYTAANLSGTDYLWLVPICDDCHRKRHDGLIRAVAQSAEIIEMDCAMASHLKSISC